MNRFIQLEHFRGDSVGGDGHGGQLALVMHQGQGARLLVHIGRRPLCVVQSSDYPLVLLATSSNLASTRAQARRRSKVVTTTSTCATGSETRTHSGCSWTRCVLWTTSLPEAEFWATSYAATQAAFFFDTWRENSLKAYSLAIINSRPGQNVDPTLCHTRPVAEKIRSKGHTGRPAAFAERPPQA